MDREERLTFVRPVEKKVWATILRSISRQTIWKELSSLANTVRRLLGAEIALLRTCEISTKNSVAAESFFVQI